MASAAHVSIVHAGEREFAKWRKAHPDEHLDLAYADLRKLDLRDADLASANMSHADLSGADLRGSNLANAVLDGSYLSSTTLAGADLSKAQLAGARAELSNLEGARLVKAWLPDTVWLDCSLTGATLCGAGFCQPAGYPRTGSPG